jgi:hypothetical protein
MATPTEISTYTVVVTDGAGNSGSTSSTVHLTDGNWVIGGPMAACSAVGLTGTAAAHSFSPDGTQTCTTSNSDATAYVCPTVHRNTRITGTMTVTDDGGDDDWIGFVWGWQNSSQFYILTWKRFAQSVGACSGVAGILIKRFDAQGPITNADLACNQDTPNATVLLSPTDTISTGWTEGIEYGVELLYTEGRTEITITDQTNGVAVVSVVVTDDAYPSGQFGTYDWSQVNACNGPWVSTCTD